jgi:hypothetical protein
MRTYASCFVVQGDAGVKLIPDTAGASVATYTASNIAAKSMRLRKRGIQQVPTVMRVEFTDTTSTPWKTGTAEVLAAGVSAGTTQRRESSISLPGVQTYEQAYREAVERINKLTLGDLSCEFVAFDEALACEVGDIITVSHPIGLTSKQMRVTNVSAASVGRWKITASEYDPAMYSTTVQTQPTFSDTDLPSPAEPPAVAGLTATEEVYQLENGTYSSRIKLAWTAADYPYVQHYRVEVFRLGELVFSSNARDPVARTPAVQEGVEYVCKVATVTTIGAVGDWAQINITPAGKYLVPGDVPSLTCFEAGGTVHVDWLPAIDIDIWRYEVRYSTTAGTWADATMIDRVDALRLTSDQIPVGTWKIHVKALDSVGQYSATAATANVVVTSDAASFFVDSYDSTTPTLTNMASFTLAPTDSATYYVTEDNAMWGAKYSSNLSTYSNALATYHASVTSTWLGESEDFGQLLGGQWTGNSLVSAISGSLTSYLGLSQDGSAWTYLTGLSQKENGRFARLKHESLTTSTLLVTVPTQNIRLDAIPREEVGSGTSSSTGPVAVVLENSYVAVKKLSVSPEGSTARVATYDHVVVGSKIPNGDFEQPTLAGWALVEGSGTASRSTIIKHDGLASMVMADPVTTAYGCQVIPVAPGQVLTLGAWVYSSAAVANGFYFRVNHKDTYPAGGYATQALRSGYIDLFSNAALASGWEYKTASYTVPAGANWISISFYHWTGMVAATLAIDSVTVGGLGDSFEVYVFDSTGNKISSNFRYEFQGV